MRKHYFALTILLLASFVLLFSGCEDPVNTPVESPADTPETPQIVNYTVTFNANNGAATGSTASITAQANSTITLTQNGFILQGYTFTGWNTAADGSGTSYADRASLQLIGNLTLYAQWAECTSARIIEITVGSLSDLTVTKSQNGNIITFSSEECDSYNWTLDDTQISSTRTCTINTSTLLKGTYALSLEASKVGKWHSYFAQIKVVE